MQQPPIPTAVKANIEARLKQARRQLVAEGRVHPVAIVVGTEEVIIDALAQSDHDSDRIAFMTREMVNLNDAHTVVLVTEAWALPTDMPTEEAHALIARYGEIAACPQRVEKVFVIVETREGRNWLAQAAIIRKGRAVVLGPPYIIETTGAEAGGRYAGNFAPAKPLPDLAAYTGTML
jgi:hypothetical protein